MKLFIVKAEPDQFEKAKMLLERDLTPQERRWLILADEMLKRTGNTRFAKPTSSKAA